MEPLLLCEASGPVGQPAAPPLAATFLLAQESNQRMPFECNAHLGLVRHLITRFRPAVGRLEMAAVWCRSGKPSLRVRHSTSASEHVSVSRGSAALDRCRLFCADINGQRRTGPRVAVLGQARQRHARRRCVLKCWLSAGPRRHGLPERTLKRCHFGAANGSSKPCDEVADQALMCVCIQRRSLVTFLSQQESDRQRGRSPRAAARGHKPNGKRFFNNLLRTR